MKTSGLGLGIRTAAWLMGALAALGPAGARGQSVTPRAETWVTDGVVYAIACTPTTIYIGGNFHWVGPPSGTGGVTRNNIAALDTATGGATSWDPNANSHVFALAVSEDGSRVYAGGTFTSIGGQSRNYIAALDATTGAATGWKPGASNKVYALAVSGSKVYAGGLFQWSGGQYRSRIAALDAATGLATGWNPDVVGSNGPRVYALALSGSTVYIGGRFGEVGGQGRNNVAALDAATGSATAWDPNVDGDVRALAASGSTVFIGGSFSKVGDRARNNIAAISAATGSPTVFNPNADDAVRALAVSGSTVYAAGSFTRIGGQPRNFVAGLDAATGLASAWDPHPAGGWACLYALAVSPRSVFIGGNFAFVGGQPRSNFAEFDLLRPKLTVESQNPDSGLTVVVAPTDLEGHGNGSTPFTRWYESPTTVTLTAPASASGNTFKRWLKDGAPFTTNTVATVGMDGGHAMKAVYQDEEIEVRWQDNGHIIADGDATPSPTDGTDFGSPQTFGGTVERTFIIANVGTGELTLIGPPMVEITGDNVTDFSITQTPSSPIGPSGSTTFQVTFAPNAGPTGARRATLSIPNSDSDENPYDFAIQGTVGPPRLLEAADAGAGLASLSWENPAGPPGMYLGFAWDVYNADWAKTNPQDPATMWQAFPPEATSGTMQLDWTGAYHVWISSWYADGNWYACLNPWTGVLYSGVPHTPHDVWAEGLGGGKARLHWTPEIYGTWHEQIIVLHVTSLEPLEGEWITVDGPSGTALWHFVDYGGFAYDGSKANFFGAHADFTLPGHGAYSIYIRGAGWLPPYTSPTTGSFASAIVELAP